MRYRPTDASVRRAERIKLGQVKRARLSEGILLDRNEWRKLIHMPDPT